jgi:ABC-type uncharacterized transport system substrate-binding protein
MSHTHRHSSPDRRRAQARSGLCAWLLALCCCLPALGAAASADPLRVLVLLSESGGPYGELVEALKERTGPGGPHVESRLVPDGMGELGRILDSRPALVVPVGIRATAMVLRASGDLPVLSLLIPQNSYAALLADTGANGHSGSRSAIYMDQPLARQLDLLRLLLPKTNRLAVLVGPDSLPRLPELQQLCERRGLQLVSERVAAGDNPVPALMRLTDRAGVLLALPDPAVFNRTSLQAILLTTYRSNVPVLGFSRAYVNAGALAAVHSTARQIGAQAGEWIAELHAHGDWRLGAPRHPGYYSISVNAQVAKSLGIGVADERSLLERLRTLETASP